MLILSRWGQTKWGRHADFEPRGIDKMGRHSDFEPRGRQSGVDMLVLRLKMHLYSAAGEKIEVLEPV